MLTSRPCRPMLRRRLRRRRHTCMLQRISVRDRKKSAICATRRAIPIGFISAFSRSRMSPAFIWTRRFSKPATRRWFGISDPRSSGFRSAHRSAAGISHYRNAPTRGRTATLPKAAFAATGRSPSRSLSFRGPSRRWFSEPRPDPGAKVGRSVSAAVASSSQV